MINLTPHAVHLHLGNGEVLTFPPSGTVARAKELVRPAHESNGIRVVYCSYGEVEGVPPPCGTPYLVSALVRAALPHRVDVFSPGELVRNEAGAVIGCRTLVANPPLPHEGA